MKTHAILLILCILALPLLAGYVVALAQANSFWTYAVAVLGGVCTGGIIHCTKAIDQ